MKKEGKVPAILSYLTLLGWIIGYILHTRNRTAFAAFHLRQSLFLHLFSILLYAMQLAVLYFPVPVIAWLLGMIFLFAGIAWLIFWAIGIIFAFGEEMRPIPVFGGFAQRLFSGLK